MTILDSPQELIGKSLVGFWQQNEELKTRFRYDDKDGASRYVAFVQTILLQHLGTAKAERLAKARKDAP